MKNTSRVAYCCNNFYFYPLCHLPLCMYAAAAAAGPSVVCAVCSRCLRQCRCCSASQEAGWPAVAAVYCGKRNGRRRRRRSGSSGVVCAGSIMGIIMCCAVLQFCSLTEMQCCPCPMAAVAQELWMNRLAFGSPIYYRAHTHHMHSTLVLIAILPFSHVAVVLALQVAAPGGSGLAAG